MYPVVVEIDEELLTEPQLTIRGVPAQVKKLLRHRADSERKSLNAVLVEVLSAAAGLAARDKGYSDLDDLAGRWLDDPAFDDAIRAQDQVDQSIWT